MRQDGLVGPGRAAGAIADDGPLRPAGEPFQQAPQAGGEVGGEQVQ